MKSHALPTLGIVVLAAGFSTRLGQSKALARVRGTSLLARTIRVLKPFATAGILVIVPPGANRYRRDLPARTAAFVVNRQRALGLSSSVRAGIRRARYCSAVLLLPVDLVELSGSDLARLVSRWRGQRRRAVARRIGRGAGTPLILPRWLYSRALQLSGDQGLREMVGRLSASALSLLDLSSAEFDIDTPGDLKEARRRLKRG